MRFKPHVVFLVGALLGALGCQSVEHSDPSMPPESPLGKEDSGSNVFAIDGKTHTLGAGYIMAYSLEPKRTLDLIGVNGSVYTWYHTGSAWKPLGWIGAEQHLELTHDDGPLWLAFWGEGSQISTRFRDEARFSVSRVIISGPPLAGSEHAVVLAGVRSNEIVSLYVDDVQVDAWALPAIEGMAAHNRVVGFAIPEDALPGCRTISARSGDRTSARQALGVANIETIETRETLAAMTHEWVAENLGADISVVGGYAPLPIGASVDDATGGEDSYKVTTANTYMFYAFDSSSGFEQPDGTLIMWSPKSDPETPNGPIIRKRRGPPEIINPNTGLLWAEPGGGLHAGGMCGTAWARLHQGGFGYPYPQPPGAGGNPGGLHQPPKPTPGPPVTTTSGPNSGWPNGFTGTVTGPCPNGRKSHVIILQLYEDKKPKKDDPDFDVLTKSVEKSFTKLLDKSSVQVLTPVDFMPNPPPSNRKRVRLDLAKKLAPTIDAIAAADKDCCTDITLVILSHGAENNGTINGERYPHVLSFRHVDTNGKVFKGDKRGPGKGNTTGDIMKKVAELLNARAANGKSCIPVTVVDHSCYSGGTTAQDGRSFKETFKDGEPDEIPHDNIRVVASSSSTETSKGHKDDVGHQHIYFFEAMRVCMADKKNDTDPKDGFISLKEALACIKTLTNTLSKKSKADGGAGKTQQPQFWPPLSQW